MIGRDFIESARALAQSDRPCDLRSAVSRAYYASFHAALLICESQGIRFPKSIVHTKMPQCFDNSNVPGAQKVGRKLASLRDDRNNADYDVADLLFEDSGEASDRIRVAETIIDEIDSLVSEPTEYRNLAALLVTAARKLGIPVRV